MKQQYAQEWPHFFTATIQEWKPLLKEDKYKNVIVDSLKYIVSSIEGCRINYTLPVGRQAKGNNKYLQTLYQFSIKCSST